jgi:hypothetical protein
MRHLIHRAIRQADDLVLVFDYLDSKGVMSRRVVSPVRFLGNERFLALCLSREEPRQFYLNRCFNLRLDRSTNYVMPVPMVAIPLLAEEPVAMAALTGAEVSQGVPVISGLGTAGGMPHIAAGCV